MHSMTLKEPKDLASDNVNWRQMACRIYNNDDLPHADVDFLQRDADPDDA